MTSEEKAYLVISLKEINKLARLARRHKKAHQAAGRFVKNHTIVLSLDIAEPEYNGSEGERQICNLHRAFWKLQEDIEKTERVAPTLRAAWLKKEVAANM
jgi:hypothetical protein